ncbi:MAG TPA: Rrf2 family transcriptional regulator, partial [Acidobacteriota bacterium]|nr:Rrf2 family transcriptional regulator [Acidobacteriota bacterium]
MHLTYRTDYSIRVLLYLALYPDRLVTTKEISEVYGISKNHLVRVVL